MRDFLRNPKSANAILFRSPSLKQAWILSSPKGDFLSRRCLERLFLRNPNKLPLAPCSNLFRILLSQASLDEVSRKSFAERGGFEPPKPFWSLHAFQACLFNHSSISPSR